METLYSIRLEDNVTASAARVQNALVGVSRAAERTAAAVQTNDRAYQAVARQAARFAQAELQAARALNAVDKNSLKAAKDIEKLNRPLADGAEKAGKSWLGSAKSFAVGAVALGYLAARAIEVGRSFVEAAGGAQTWERNFSRITGDAREIQETRNLIKSLGIGLEEGEHAMLALRTQFDKADAQAFLKIFKALSLTNEEAQRFSLVLGQISGAGVLKGQDLNQVLQLPGFNRGAITEQIAKEMKIGVAEAAARLGNAKIPADVAIRAIVYSGLASHGLKPDATAPETPQGKLSGVDRGIAEASGSIDTQLSKVDNRILELKRNLGQKLADAGFIDDLNRLVTVLEKVADAAGTAYAGIHKLIGGVADQRLDIAPTSVEGTAKFVAKAAAKTPGEVLGAAGDFNDWIVKWAGAAGDAVFGSGQKTAGNLDQGLANGLTGASQAEQAATQLGSGVVDATNAAAGVHSPSDLTADTGKFLDEGLAIGITDSQDLAFEAASSMADGVVSEVDMLSAAGAGVNQSALTSAAAGAGSALATGSGEGGGTTIGQVSVAITVDGAKDPATTVDAIRDFFELDFAALLERHIEAQGG